MTNKDKCISETSAHILSVTKLINIISTKILERGVSHDASKLVPPELDYFTKYTHKLAASTYGSPEYEKCLVDMKPALDHHYAVNRHHPQHFPDGIKGMNLVDLVELICDWKASSLRHNDGNILKSIEVNVKRFEMSEDLTAVLRNTCELLEM